VGPRTVLYIIINIRTVHWFILITYFFKKSKNWAVSEYDAHCKINLGHHHYYYYHVAKWLVLILVEIHCQALWHEPTSVWSSFISSHDFATCLPPNGLFLT